MDINWPEVVVGFLLGSLPVLIRQFYLYFRFLRSPGRRRYLGHWHAYWRSTTGNGRIGHEQIDVRYSFVRNTLLVTTQSSDLDGSNRIMEYTGTISERRGVVRYWYLRENVTHVQETWIMFDPYYDPIDAAEGVQVTVDVRGLPVATGQLISRIALGVEELERLVPEEVINTDPLKSFLNSSSRDGDGTIGPRNSSAASPSTPESQESGPEAR